jgi:CheY-like chemotaxis protein
LLDLARIKADKIELRPEHVDLRDIVDAAITTSRPVVEGRRHTLTVNAPEYRVMVVADTIRLTQVVCNLINNATRYTNPGGRIDVTIGVEDDAAFVRVRDNGMGIPAELQHSIFDMFVQERVRSDGSGGLGLGLALARRLVEMHNGSIRCHSEGANRGSTFEIRVPRTCSAAALTPRKRTADIEPLRDSGAKLVRTVVVDDNADAREMLCELLRANGYEVLAAEDGPSGVGLIREHRPEVAFVDLGLPVLDGCGVAEQLHKECPDLKTRLIALTGYGAASDQERTTRAGFHAHLVKPATAAAIMACVWKQIDAFNVSR